jgi:hypothetical protein
MNYTVIKVSTFIIDKLTRRRCSILSVFGRLDRSNDGYMLLELWVSAFTTNSHGCFLIICVVHEIDIAHFISMCATDRDSVIVIIVIGACAHEYIVLFDIVHFLGRVEGLGPLWVANSELSPLVTANSVGCIHVAVYVCMNAKGKHLQRRTRVLAR